MACHVIKININQKTNYLRLPVQFCPSPINPGLHRHTYDPYVLLHVASSWHLPMDASHLSKEAGGKYTNRISTKDISVCFLSKSHRNSAIRKNLNLFVTSCFEWFSGGNFQLSYYFWALLAVTILSIRHTYKRLLFCHGKASNVQGKQKNKKNKTTKNSNNNKQQTIETNQNKTKIFKRANKEYITHAQ